MIFLIGLKYVNCWNINYMYKFLSPKAFNTTVMEYTFVCFQRLCFYFRSPVYFIRNFVKMKFLSIMDEWKCEAYPRIGDSIAFIFKHTYTATRIIINQLSIKCTRTRTITFPQLYNIRSNWKEGDEFLLPQKPLRTTLSLLLPSLSITSIPHMHTDVVV